jgi:hypothetical protein
MTFSQRIGKEPVSKPLQLEAVDKDLKNSLWNIVHRYLIIDGLETELRNHQWELAASKYRAFFVDMWHYLLKWPLTSLDTNTHRALNQVREWYFGNMPWHKVYDFVEFVARYVRDKWAYIGHCNLTLERESSGYRFVEDKLAQITNTEEIEAIEAATKRNVGPLAPVGEHISSALRLLSDRTQPDFQNSIKESISAVESACGLITEAPNDGLAKALEKLGSTAKLHGALVEGFKRIYGYTSDADGIRHGMIEESGCDFEDAKDMLVSCSAFANYLIAKAIKARLLSPTS